MEAPTPPPLPPPPPSHTAVAARPGWWSRNWKWFVPTGCLSLIVLACTFVVAIALIVVTAVKSSDAYKMAVSRAKSDQRVVRAIGTPVDEGWWVAGSSEVSGGSGKADLTIPVHGPNGKATVYAVATKFAGDWRYSKLVVKVDKTGETIDLLATPR